MSKKSVFVCDVCRTEEINLCGGYEIGVVGLPLVQHCCVSCKAEVVRVFRAFRMHFETKGPIYLQAGKEIDWGKIVILGIKGV